MPCHMSHDIIETSVQHGDATSFEDELLEALLDSKNDSIVCRRAAKGTKARSFQRPVGRTRKRARARTVEVPRGKGDERLPTVHDDDGMVGLGLTDLPLDCLEKIVSRLSPTALCCVSQMCRVLNRIASSQSLWKALYHMRWSSTGNELIEHDEIVGETVSWKALYMRQDAEDLVGKGGMVDDGQGQLYIQMAKAFREHTLTDREVDLCMYGGEVCIPGSVSEHAERFKLVHAIRNGGSEEHACEYVRLVRHHWICRHCGVVHACGESCLETQRCAGDDMMVCRLTGCCSREMLSTDYKGEDGHGDGNHEEAGMGGRLGRAFFAGYNAADNKEMMTRFGVSIED